MTLVVLRSGPGFGGCVHQHGCIRHGSFTARASLVGESWHADKPYGGSSSRQGSHSWLAEESLACARLLLQVLRNLLHG